MRRPGPWIAISTHYLSNRKVRRCSVPARMLHLASIMWAGEHMNDGEIPEEMLDVLLVYSGAGREHAQELVMAGLWELHEPDGYVIHDYLEWNTASEEIESKRSLGRERQRRFRADHVTRDARVTDAAVTPKSRAVEVEVEVEENTCSPSDARPIAFDPPKQRARLGPSVSAHHFEGFWNEYPRKVGKLAARKAWDKAMKATGPLTIRAALRAALPELSKKDPQYIPHPATWLNQGRWEDETSVPGLASVVPQDVSYCHTCDRKAVRGSGGCPNGVTQATADVVERPVTDLCPEWEWLHDRPQGALRGVPRMDDQRARDEGPRPQAPRGPGGTVVGRPPDVRPLIPDGGDHVLQGEPAGRLGARQGDVVGRLIPGPRGGGGVRGAARPDAR